MYDLILHFHSLRLFSTHFFYSPLSFPFFFMLNLFYVLKPYHRVSLLARRYYGRFTFFFELTSHRLFIEQKTLNKNKKISRYFCKSRNEKDL